jgi:dTDP-4-amino-4,6-dideoxygalactose transaminase
MGFARQLTQNGEFRAGFHEAAAMIPVLRPKLPAADRIAPYLAAIDGTRWYSNFGPQACALEERLAAHFRLVDGTVTTVANATLGLALALSAQGARAGTLCAMPGWTFVASANAAALAGLIPYFIDVDPTTWALDPGATADEIGRAPGPVGAVMVVAPFGRPIDYPAWDDFKRRSGLPVVIDAAAAFDSLQVGDVPAVVSLHATKIIGVGEGGFIASRDKAVIGAIRRQSNFGLDHNRNAAVAGFNAKLSEYHAAVGLAALDAWRESRGAWVSAAAGYREAFANSNVVRLPPGFGETWVSSTLIVAVDRRVHAQALQALAAAAIETRLWWGSGAHAQPATAAFPRAALPTTEALATSTLGLPFYPDLASEQIRRIAATLTAAASPQGSP